MKTKHTITAAVLALAAACAQAAPYAITYESAITGSNIPTVIDPQRFTLTLVMDNDGSSTANAEWVGGDLTCAIWRMNDAANVVVAHDLTLAPPYSAVGRVTTDGGGTLTEVFSSVVSGSSVAPAAVRAIGLPPGDPLDNWAANSSNARVLFLASTRRFADASGHIQMTPAQWSSPVPFTGNCLDAAGPASAGGGIASVPTLGHAALALLSAFVGGLGLRMRRRNS